jgi:phosphatidate cytidylyltransferase
VSASTASPVQSNLFWRVVVAFIAGPAILASIYFGGMIFLGMMLFIALMSLYEFTVMVNQKQVFPIRWLMMLFCAAILVNHKFRLISTLDFLLLAVFFFPTIELFRKRGAPISNIGSSFLCLFYISFPFLSLMDMRGYDKDGVFITMIFIAVWMSDTFAYFGGKFLGGKVFKSKFSERYSPKKTWEGFFAGSIASTVTAWIFSATLLSPLFAAVHILIIGLIIGLLSPIGDLIESMFKRDSGVKDSSGLIPGHGGFFDRFDSLCFIAPVVFLYARYVMNLN